MRGMHDRKQTKILGGREEEGDTARRKSQTGRERKVWEGGCVRRLSHPFSNVVSARAPSDCN